MCMKIKLINLKVYWENVNECTNGLLRDVTGCRYYAEKGNRYVARIHCMLFSICNICIHEIDVEVSA